MTAACGLTLHLPPLARCVNNIEGQLHAAATLPAHQGCLLPLKGFSSSWCSAALRHVCSAPAQSLLPALLPAQHACTARMPAHIESPLRRSRHTAPMARCHHTLLPWTICPAAMASHGRMLSAHGQLLPGVAAQCLRCRHMDVASVFSSLHRSFANSTELAPHALQGQ